MEAKAIGWVDTGRDELSEYFPRSLANGVGSSRALAVAAAITWVYPSFTGRGVRKVQGPYRWLQLGLWAR